jgi:hypothetical protein
MPTHPIVKALDVLENDSTSMIVRHKDAAIDTLLLEGSKEPLHDGIIVAVSLPAHAHADPLRTQELLMALAGLLRSPIRMMQYVLAWLPAGYCHAQGIFH